MNAMREETTILYRPVGPRELELIAASGYREFPPRLPEQPIFYPVLNEEYARQIARDWNVRARGAGYVTRFAVRKEFAERYPVQSVGGHIHQELWIPAESLAEMNRNIIGLERGLEFLRRWDSHVKVRAAHLGYMPRGHHLSIPQMPERSAGSWGYGSRQSPFSAGELP